MERHLPRIAALAIGLVVLGGAVLTWMSLGRSRLLGPSSPAEEAAGDADGRRLTRVEGRADTARDLGRRKARGAVTYLLAYLKDDDPQVREACAWALGEIGDRRAVMDLALRLDDDPEAKVREAVARALAALGDESSVGRLAERLNDDSAAVRLAAVQALAMWAPAQEAALAALVRAVADEDPAVREAAAKSVREAGSAAVASVVAAARTAKSAVRVRHVGLLAAMKDPAAVPPLLAVLAASDPGGQGRYDPAVRSAVVDALAALGEPAVEPLALATVPLAEQLPLKTVAAEVMARTRSAAAVAHVRARMLKWRRVPSPEEHALWTGLLRRIDTPEAKAALAQVEAHLEARRRETDAPAPLPLGDHPTADGLEGSRGNRDVTLRLRGAVAGKDLLVELECRGGRWPETAWAYAPNFNKGDHEFRVARAERTASGVRLGLEGRIADDPWTRGGPADYEVLLAARDGRLTGTYRGRFRGRTAEGDVEAAIADPTPVEFACEPLRPQEHPRMRGREYRWEPPARPVVTEGGRAAMERVLHPPGAALAADAGRPAVEVALLYDQYYWQADPDLRRQAADSLLQMARNLYGGTGGMTTPWHNWQANWRGGAAAAALAILGDPTSYPPRPADEPVVALDPPADCPVGEGVPLVELGASARPEAPLSTRWLVAGPLPVNEEVDYLADLGGPTKASPAPGAAIGAGDARAEFRPFEGAPMEGQAQDIDLEPLLQKRRRQVLYFFTVVENLFPHTVRVALDARTRLWVAGRRVEGGQVLAVGAGRFPVLAEATVGDLAPFARPRWMLPQFKEVGDPREALRAWEDGYRRWEASGGAHPDVPRLVKILERNCERYVRWAIGDGGFNCEKESYTHVSFALMAPFLRGYLECFGKNLVWDSHAAWVPLRHKAGTVGGKDVVGPFYSGEHIVDLVAPAFKRALGARTPAEFPGYCVRDRQKTGYIFRNGWKDAGDIFMTVEGKGQHLRGAHTSFDTGTFRLYGLGTAWAVYSDYSRDAPRPHHNVVLFPDDEINGTLGAREVHFEAAPDGSAAVTLDMNDVYLGAAADSTHALADFEARVIPKAVRDLGIRGVRAFAADYSGACGAPALFVVADRITGGGRKEWTMHLPSGPRRETLRAEAQGHVLTLRSSRASLRATFLAPEGARVEVADTLVKVAGPGDFLVVMTLQEGPPPDVRAEGRGLDAVVTVGGRTVRLDGTRLVLGPPGGGRL